MKFNANSGASTEQLENGYEKLDGDPPYTGENIMNPQHIARQKAYDSMFANETDIEVGGFLDRDVPSPYSRPQRGEDEDRG